MLIPPRISTPLPANAQVRLKLQVRRGPLQLPVLLPRVEVKPRRSDLLG